ncbi:MFS transporter [Flexithrix dorotheae]|uniref:MFS transporter n=1 Tax=Flexithrix dorotheae TaxID=70993 RepID=UPI00035C7D89|nr:MFS transporter [Flexithrix dorotheae]
MVNFFSGTLRLYKDAYSGHPREIWVLVMLTLINRMGMMVLPFLTVYLTTVLHFPLDEAGLLISAFGFGSLGGSFIGGKLSDKIGANKVIALSLFLGGFFLMTIQFAHTFSSLYALIFTSSLFGEAYRPALMVAVGNYVPKSESGRAISFIRLAINIGFSLAPAIGGFIAATFSYSWLFWIDGTTCVLAATYFWIESRNWSRRTINRAENLNSLEENVRPPYKDWLYVFMLFSSFLYGFVFIQWFHSVPVFIKTDWGFDERYIGLLMGTSGFLITLIEMPAIHSVEKNRKINPSILLGVVLLAFSFIPFLLPSSLFLAFMAMFFFTIGEIFYLPLINATALNMSPDAKRGEYMSWYWMMWSMAHITGPTVGLSFIEKAGFSTFWSFTILITMVSFFLHHIFLKKLENTPP